MKTHQGADLYKFTANVIRGLAIDAVQKANSGHPGMPMGMADVATVLWSMHLRHLPDEPDWRGRDRFVLSAGHGSMLLYGVLHLSGYDVTLDDLREFRQWESKTPGHPEAHHTPGVETTTGPLGQGFGNGVGMALAAKMEAGRFGSEALCTRVFGIVSDGDLMEGIHQEAASIAGHLQLDNLVYLYDDNRITIDGATELSFSEDVEARFRALGWAVFRCDGHDMTAIDESITQAIAANQPSLVICRTEIGYGSPAKRGTSASHGAPLGTDEVVATKTELGLPTDETFWAPKEARSLFADQVERSREARKQVDQQVSNWRSSHGAQAQAHRRFLQRDVPEDLEDQLLAAVAGQEAATRALSGKVIQAAAALVPSLVGGAADLDSSTKTGIKDGGDVAAGSFSGRNIHFGIREHAMGAIMSGMALHGGFLPMGSTFLVFSDYVRPSIRLAALMGVPSVYVFTHDSVMVGEDGPTHQPVEHVGSLRMIPGLEVWRPADATEVAVAWSEILQRRDGPCALILTRQGLPAIQRPKSFKTNAIHHGGYVVFEPSAAATAVVMATGSEVHVAVEAAKLLENSGQASLRVMSIPCVERYVTFTAKSKDAAMDGLPVCAVELGRPETWFRFATSPAHVVSQDGFGASAPAETLAEQFGFTPHAVAERLMSALA